MKSKEQQIDRTEVFEWYDGVILGLTHLQGRNAFVCLLAFDPDSQRRLYLIAMISNDLALAIRGRFENGGCEAFAAETIKTILEQSSGLYLTESRLEDGKGIELAPLTPRQIEQLPSLAFPLVDEAVSEERKLAWLK